jgi:hypothetical protein
MSKPPILLRNQIQRRKSGIWKNRLFSEQRCCNVKCSATIKAGLSAPAASQGEAATALPPAELRTIHGYPDYDAQAKPFIVTA